MFAVCRLQELGRKACVTLFLYFIDLQKAYGSVDHTLLWYVLTRFGVPKQMIEIIRQFLDEVKACMKNDNGVCSEWLEVAQGLRQGCVLSPLLFNISFVAILLVAQERFSEDVDILAQSLPILKSSQKRLALKRHWNVRVVLFEGCYMLTTSASC